MRSSRGTRYGVAAAVAGVTLAAAVIWPLVSVESDRASAPTPTEAQAPTSLPDTLPVSGSEVSVMAVGDIACDTSAPAFNDGQGTAAGCRHAAVADVVRVAEPDAFIALGDLQYPDGSYEQIMGGYDKAFGDLKDITMPIPGNHEYQTRRAEGYFRYFGDQAHPESDGTYSFNVGSWHVLAINSTKCTDSKPCGPESSMAKWIAADVAANPSRCLMAVWHHPVWSVGRHGSYAPMAPVWNQLDSYGADLVLSAHDHLYQRFAPLGPAEVLTDGSVADPVVTPGGMVQFVVGTGGVDNYTARIKENPGVAAALAVSASNPDPAIFGALHLTLGPERYGFEFRPAAGVDFTDSGTQPCRAKTPPA